MWQSNNLEQQPLTEEAFREILMANNDKVYRKGYNDACVIISAALKMQSEDVSGIAAEILKNVSDTILKCKLAEE